MAFGFLVGKVLNRIYNKVDIYRIVLIFEKSRHFTTIFITLTTRRIE